MNCLKCNNTIAELPVHGFHNRCFAIEFKVTPSRNTNFSKIYEQTANSAAPRTQNDPAFRRFNSSFFHGKYRKYSASLEDRNYILKLGQQDCVELPIIEFICNQLARKLGLEIPDFHLIRFENAHFAFVSRNFMDGLGTATSDHIYKFLDEGFNLDCETLIEAIKKNTGRLSEVERFTELCLFDSWIGNHDRHGRNLTLITKAGSMRTLSPFYDNPSYIGIAEESMLGADHQPRGAIFTFQSEEPTMKDYVIEFNRLGLTSVVERFRQKLTDNSTDLIGIVQNSPLLSEARKKAFITLLEKRLTELENA